VGNARSGVRLGERAAVARPANEGGAPPIGVDVLPPVPDAEMMVTRPEVDVDPFDALADSAPVRMSEADPNQRNGSQVGNTFKDTRNRCKLCPHLW
jgi:hypothetical protein